MKFEYIFDMSFWRKSFWVLYAVFVFLLHHPGIFFVVEMNVWIAEEAIGSMWLTVLDFFLVFHRNMRHRQVLKRLVENWRKKFKKMRIT